MTIKYIEMKLEGELQEATQFQKLAVGDVFIWGTDTFIKISDHWVDIRKAKDTRPNCFDFNRGHYCVFGLRALVYRLKSIDDFDPNLEPWD